MNSEVLKRCQALTREELNVTRIISSSRTTNLMKQQLNEINEQMEQNFTKAISRRDVLSEAAVDEAAGTDRESKPLLDPNDESLQNTPQPQQTASPRVEVQEVMIIMDEDHDPVDVLEKARAEDEKTRFDRTRMTLEERNGSLKKTDSVDQAARLSFAEAE